MTNNRTGVVAALKTLLCAVISLLLVYVLLAALAYHGLQGAGGLSAAMREAYQGGLKNLLLGGLTEPGRGWKDELLRAAPLMLTALSVSLAYKAGLYNIGVWGQCALGFLGAYLGAALGLPWYACMLCAAAAGALWGVFACVFRGRVRHGEVIPALLLNWVGVEGTGALISSGLLTAQTAPVIPTLFHITGLTETLIAVLPAVIVWLLLKVTVFGYELRACGSSPAAAEYMGVDEKRKAAAAMALSGAMAGLSGGLCCLSGTAGNSLSFLMLPGMDGIASSVLSWAHPLGGLVTALFTAHMTAGAAKMNNAVFPQEMARFIAGIAVYPGALMLLFLRREKKKRTAKRGKRY